jgi:hypothetical protein
LTGAQELEDSGEWRGVVYLRLNLGELQPGVLDLGDDINEPLEVLGGRSYLDDLLDQLGNLSPVHPEQP